MDHGWSAAEPVGGFAVVLVRQGVFRRRSDGVELLADPMVGYCEYPGSEQQIAHPHGGDICTAIELPMRVLGSLADPNRFRPGSPLLVAPILDLAHRSLLRSVQQGVDSVEVAEDAILLVGHLLESVEDTPSRMRPTTATLYRRITNGVRQDLGTDPHLGLEELAVRNTVSIYQLSRAFRAVTGTTFSRYRTRLRARLAIDRIANGERHLAHLAAELGFADQAHMTRALRMETEFTPGDLRSILFE